MAPLVSEEKAADHVTDGVHPVLGGAQIGAGPDESALQLDRGGLQADPLGVRGAPDGDQEHLGRDLLLLTAVGDGDRHASLIAADRAQVEPGPDQAPDATRLEVLAQLGADRPILQLSLIHI